MIEQLKSIFDAAADEVEALRCNRIELLRQGQEAPSLSTFQEQRRAITRNSMEQARQLLSVLSNTDLINFAALCFAQYHDTHRQAIKTKERSLSVTKSFASLLDRVGNREKSLKDRLKKARRKGAIVRHAETRQIKADVFVWLDSLTSEFKSTEAAARAIVKQQPIAHDTARKYFKEWKNLRSASTP